MIISVCFNEKGYRTKFIDYEKLLNKITISEAEFLDNLNKKGYIFTFFTNWAELLGEFDSKEDYHYSVKSFCKKHNLCEEVLKEKFIKFKKFDTSYICQVCGKKAYNLGRSLICPRCTNKKSKQEALLYKKMKPLKCEYCGKNITKSVKTYKEYKQKKYCSRTCSANAREY